MVEDVADKAARGRKAQPAGHEKDVLSLHGAVVEAVSEGSADTEAVALLKVLEGIRDHSDAADREFEVIALAGAGANADGRLSDAEDRDADELARLVSERFAFHPEAEESLGLGHLVGLEDPGHSRNVRAGGGGPLFNVDLELGHGDRLLVMRPPRRAANPLIGSLQSV